MLGGSGRNLTSGINGICSASSATTTCGGTYLEVSSMISMGNTVSTTDSVTALELGVEIATICD